MAKGLAVISGSNTVMFKALETGIITAGTISGSTLKPATFTLTGSLLISGSTEPVLQLEGLVNTSTASFGIDTILIKSGSYVKEATTLSGNIVLLNDGTNIETKINEIESNLGASALTVSSSTTSVQVDLDTEALKIVGTANEVEVAITETSPNVQVQVGLPNNVEISSSLYITGSASTDVLTINSGSIKVSGGQISSSGDIYTNSKVVAAGEITGSSNLKIIGSGSINGDLSVGGNLSVLGEVTVLETTNLRVEDPIIILGSGSTATDGDKGFIFQRSAADNRAFLWDDNTDKFVLGATNNDGTGTDITLTYDTAAKSTLLLHTLSASNLNADGNVVLGSDGTDKLTINSYITGSGNIVVSSSLTIGAANNVASEVTTFVSQVKMPIFSVTGTHVVSDYPAVPPLYGTNAAAYSGHMFYLTSSDGTNNEGDGNWDHANKWYFNERGVWHEMPFFYVP